MPPGMEAPSAPPQHPPSPYEQPPLHPTHETGEIPPAHEEEAQAFQEEEGERETAEKPLHVIPLACAPKHHGVVKRERGARTAAGLRHTGPPSQNRVSGATPPQNLLCLLWRTAPPSVRDLQHCCGRHNAASVARGADERAAALTPGSSNRCHAGVVPSRWCVSHSSSARVVDKCR